MSSINARRINHVSLSLLRQVMNSAPTDSINMALGELGYEMPLILREYAAHTILKETPRYTANAGLPELKSAIAAYHGEFYPPEGVCVTNGAEEALYAAMMAFLNPGDKIAIVEPYYSAYATIAGICEASVIPLPYASDLKTIPWEDWEKSLSQNIKVLLFSNPSNPLGTFFTQDEVSLLCSLCAKYHILIFADEIYHDLYWEDEPMSFAGKYPDLILISGVSKSLCMSGWRMGWAIGDPALIGYITKAHQYISTCANWLAQKVTAYALSQERAYLREDVCQQLKRSYQYTADFLQTNLPAIPILQPNSTPYLLLRLGSDDVDFCYYAAQKGVIIVPGTAFGEISKGWVRINFALEAELLQSGLLRLEHALASGTQITNL